MPGIILYPPSGGGGVSFPLTHVAATAAEDQLLVGVTGDAVATSRFVLDGDGTLHFGGGASGSPKMRFQYISNRTLGIISEDDSASVRIYNFKPEGLNRYVEIGTDAGTGAHFFDAFNSNFELRTSPVITRADGTGFLELPEQSSDPSAPAANKARLFAKDNGSGKTQLAVRFPTGATQIIATEP